MVNSAAVGTAGRAAAWCGWDGGYGASLPRSCSSVTWAVGACCWVGSDAMPSRLTPSIVALHHSATALIPDHVWYRVVGGKKGGRDRCKVAWYRSACKVGRDSTQRSWHALHHPATSALPRGKHPGRRVVVGHQLHQQGLVPYARGQDHQGSKAASCHVPHVPISKAAQVTLSPTPCDYSSTWLRARKTPRDAGSESARTQHGELAAHAGYVKHFLSRGAFHLSSMAYSLSTSASQ